MNPGFSSDIGDSKNTGNPLGSSAQQVTAILDGITDGFVLVDFEWRFTYANTSAAGFLRKAKEEIVGRHVFDVFPEAKGTVFERNFRKAMEERVTVSFEAFYKPLLSWFECHCYPSPEGITVLFADATKEKHQRRERDIYRELLQSANSAIIRWKGDGTISFFNDYAQELFGYGAEEVVGKQVSIIVPEIESSGVDLTTLAWDIVNHPERHLNNVNENVCRDGRRIWMTWTNKAIYDESGEVAEILAIGNDVTELKRAEDRLQHNEARYRSTIELTEQLAWTTNAEGEVVEDLPSWRRFTGQSEEEIKGWGWSQALHPDDLDHTVRVWTRSLAEKGKYEVEYRLRRYDGVYRHFLARGVPMLDDDGRIREWVGTCIDITERKEIEELLKRSRDELEARVHERTVELERSNRELQDFAFIASHDLREPLRKIQTFGDMLVARLGETLDETSRDYLRRMQRAAARMTDFLNSLLAYSRVTTRAEQMKETSLRTCVEAALSNLEVMIEEKHAIVEIGELPVLEADGVQMIQLFQNLIGNALKFSRDGEVPHVKITSREVGDEERGLEIRVEDNGIGIQKRFLDKIFLPFQRLHGRSDYEGLGMGLAICRKILERHKGKISASSTLGGGSTFIVRLPLLAPQNG